MRHTAIYLALCSVLLSVYALNYQSQRVDNGYCNALVQDNKTANVSIVCGIDPKIHQKTQDEKSELEKTLLHTLYEKQIALEKNNVLVDKVKLAEEVVKNYNELQKAYANLQIQVNAQKDEYLSRLLAEARTALSAAQFEKAKQILDKLLAALDSVEKQIDLKAATHFTQARVALANFKPNEAYPHLKKAYELRPENFEYALTYAHTLQNSPRDHRDRNTAILTYQTILNWLRPLAEKDKVRLPDVATTLNNLANLFAKDTSRRSEAEQNYQEALKIYRELADKQPEVYRPYVATTLNNLASLLQNDTSRRSEAEQYYQEALKIKRELADKQPAVYRPDVAMTLNNLALLFANDTSRRSEAEQYYQEALKIYRELADKQAAVYRPDVATTLNNLALLFANDTTRLAEALSLITEAIEIRILLNRTAPPVFGDDLAKSFGVLGAIQMRAGKVQASCEAWRKAYDVSQTVSWKEYFTTLLKKNCSK